MVIGFGEETYGTVTFSKGNFVYGGQQPEKVKLMVENIQKETNLSGQALLEHILEIKSSYFWAGDE